MGKVRLEPLSDRVVILPKEPPDKIGLIVIPDSVKEDMRSLEGTVVAVGPGMRKKTGGRWPMPDIKEGDHVFYGPKYGATSFKLNGVVHLVMREDYIHAVKEG